MPFGTSRPSETEKSFGPGKSGDARTAGYAPEAHAASFAGTTLNGYVSEYPYQVQTGAFLSLTGYLEEEGEAEMWAFVTDGESGIIQYFSSESEEWSYSPDPSNDTWVQVSEDGGVSSNRYPIQPIEGYTDLPVIQFQRAPERPEVDSASKDPGDGWSEAPSSYHDTEPTRQTPMWVTVAVKNTSVDPYELVEEWSEAFPVRGIHNANEIIAEYSDGSDTWDRHFDGSTHTEVRFSADQGMNFTSAFTLSNGTVQFQRQTYPPSYNESDENPGTDWDNTPPLDESLPLWVVWDDSGSSDPNWRKPVQVVPRSSPWQRDIVQDVAGSTSTKKNYEVGADFRALPLSNEELIIHWLFKAPDVLDRPISGFHRYDRNQKPEFDGNVTVSGEDLMVTLVGDEDVASYKVASNIGGTSFPEAEEGDYYEGRTYRGATAINLGPIERGQEAFVTVTPYSEEEATTSGGDPEDPGKEQTFSVQREASDYLLQGRYGDTESGEFYRAASGSDSYFQISRNGGVRWSESVSTDEQSGESITERLYFQRSNGTPGVDLYEPTPGVDWKGAPPVDSITPLWMIRGPVDENGNLLDWARWTTPVILIDEVAAKTLPPDVALAEFSDQEDGPWDEEYSDGDVYVRVSWDEGANWQVSTMDTPDQNPTRGDGSEITQNVVNRFQRSSDEPTVDNDNYSSPGVGWVDFPPNGDETLWMISGLADLSEDELAGGNGQWSDPIEIISASDTAGLIEFSPTDKGPWGPLYEEVDAYLHISRDNTATWDPSRPMGDAYFKKQADQPEVTTNPTADGWDETPPTGVPNSEVPLWVTLKDGNGGWTPPEQVKQDTTPRGPQDDDVQIQYSNDKISWHDDIRSEDKWMRQRVGEGFWSAPIRIKGEAGQEGRYRSYIFQASASQDPENAPPIDSTVPDWDNTTTYEDGDVALYNDEYWEATVSNTGVTPTGSTPEWKLISEKTLDADSNWVDGPYEALQNGGEGEIYIWAINALFESDTSSTTDIRLEDWDGPVRFNGVDAEDYYIKAEDGRSIKNSNPDKILPLRVSQILGGEQGVLEEDDEGPDLYWKDPDVDYSSVSRDYDLVDTITGIDNTKTPEFNEPTITGTLTVYLRAGDAEADTSYDTVDLFDVTDGLSGGYVQTLNGVVMTHFNGRDTDAVVPTTLSFVGTFIDTNVTQHKKDIEFTGVENDSGELEISWVVGGVEDDGAITDVRVIEGGSEVTSPISDVSEILVEFVGEDPNTGDEATFSEQLQTRTDGGLYEIRAVDGTSLERYSGGTLKLEVWRSDSEGTSQVSMSNTELSLILRPDQDAISLTGSPIEVSESDIDENSTNVIQLQKPDGTVLDSVKINLSSIEGPELTKAEPDPAIDSGDRQSVRGGDFTMFVNLNEQADGYRLDWILYNADGSVHRTYDDVLSGDSETEGPDHVYPGGENEHYIDVVTPDGWSGDSIPTAPASGELTVVPVLQTESGEYIEGESIQWPLSPPEVMTTTRGGEEVDTVKAYFSYPGGMNSSSTDVGSDSNKSGQLEVSSEIKGTGTRYFVNAPQDIGPEADPSFNSVEAGVVNVQDTLTIPSKGDGTSNYIGDSDFQIGEGLVRDTTTDPDTLKVDDSYSGGGGTDFQAGNLLSLDTNTDPDTLDVHSEVPRLDLNETVTGEWTFNNDINQSDGSVFHAGSSIKWPEGNVQFVNSEGYRWRDDEGEDLLILTNDGSLGFGTADPDWNVHFKDRNVLIENTSTSQYSGVRQQFEHTAPAPGNRKITYILENKSSGGGGDAELIYRHDNPNDNGGYRNWLVYRLSDQQISIAPDGQRVGIGTSSNINNQLVVNGSVDLKSSGDLNSVNNLNVSSIDSNNGNSPVNINQPFDFSNSAIIVPVV